MFPFYNHYPGTDLHEIDLAYLLKLAAGLEADNKILMAWKAEHEEEYQDLLDKVNGLIDNLVDVIVPWDSSIAYHIFSIVEYQGTNYIAVQDVPVGVMITNTDYWQPANTVVEQINAIGLTVSDVQDEVEAIPETVYPRRAYYRPEDYGAIVDDPNTDCGPAIKQAILDANTNKGIVLLSAGKYYCTTNIELTTHIYGVDIIGTGFSALGEYGTAIVFSGGGPALHFSNGLWGSCISGLDIICEGSNSIGIRFSMDNDPAVKARTTHCQMKDMRIVFRWHGIELDNAAYVDLNNVSVMADANTHDTGRIAFLIQTDTATVNKNEYVTARNCQFVCRELSPSYPYTADSIGIKVTSCTHLYMYDTDITYCDHGIYFNAIQGYDNAFIDFVDVDVAMVHEAVTVDLDNNSLYNCLIRQLVMSAPYEEGYSALNTDRVLKVNRIDGGAAYNARIKIEDISIRTGFNNMDYYIQADGQTLGHGYCKFTYLMQSSAPIKEDFGNTRGTIPEFSTKGNSNAQTADCNDWKSAGLSPITYTDTSTNGPGYECMLLNFTNYAFTVQIAIPSRQSTTTQFKFRVYLASSQTWNAWRTLV